MELIKDVIKVDNRVDFGRFQTFIESEALVPDKKSDVYDIVKTEGYIALKKIEIIAGKTQRPNDITPNLFDVILFSYLTSCRDK